MLVWQTAASDCFPNSIDWNLTMQLNLLNLTHGVTAFTHKNLLYNNIWCGETLKCKFEPHFQNISRRKCKCIYNVPFCFHWKTNFSTSAKHENTFCDELSILNFEFLAPIVEHNNTSNSVTTHIKRHLCPLICWSSACWEASQHTYLM